MFGLDHPTAARPYIAGLLDPCTNSKLAPNIPAEVLFDRRVRTAHHSAAQRHAALHSVHWA